MRASSLALCALLVCLLARALGNEVFLACLAGTPAIGPGAPNFENLANKGYRNDVATPAAIVQATHCNHVGDAVRCANAAGLKVCARSGGHSLVGKSTCAGVLIDVSAMNGVVVAAADGVATIGAGANIGQVLWELWKTRRWFAAGVCPGVGIAGYMLGGGHGPYEGKLGLACDALVEVTLIDRFGKMLVASTRENKELFWGLCGAGGGQFGVVTEFKIKTAPSAKFDDGVVFKIEWPRSSAGEVISKWTNYDEKGGDVWFRIEQKMGNVLDGYGACYSVKSTDECLKRLQSAPFYNAPGVRVVYMSKVDNALDLHAFFGPGGEWGSFRAGNVRNATLGQAFSHVGLANTRSFLSTFMGKDACPGPEFWQRWADVCGDPGLGSIWWNVCQINLFNNAIDGGADNAFAHRSANVITHYIIGSGSPEHRQAAYWRMKQHFAPTTTGVYANYPELELQNYAQMYWGSSLKRLSALKKQYDPELFFANSQPIPL